MVLAASSGSSRSAPCRPAAPCASLRRPGRGACVPAGWPARGPRSRTRSQVGRVRSGARRAGAPWTRSSWGRRRSPRPEPLGDPGRHPAALDDAGPRPGSRSNTMWSGGAGSSGARPTCHSGTWNSMLARLAAHTSDGRVATARRTSTTACPAGSTRAPSPSAPTRGRASARASRRTTAVDAVGVPLQGHRAVAEVGRRTGAIAGVVVDDLALGEARLGVEHLVEVGQRQPPCRPPRSRPGRSRAHARPRPGTLSGRRPRHAGGAGARPGSSR